MSVDTKILGWQIDDVKNLLRFIDKNKDLTLSKVFSIWANQNARQTFSVRNFYYKLIKILHSDKKLCNVLGIDKQLVDNSVLTKHFSREQSIWLLENILPNNPRSSIRAKCLKLANGNISKMIRYQNKFRNLIEKQKQLVTEVLQNLKDRQVETINPFKKLEHKAKILNMPSQNDSIDDAELEALFKGLVKLVKANAEKVVNIKNQHENSLVNNALSVAIANLRKKDIVINDINKENEKLKSSLSEAQYQLSLLKSQNVSNLAVLHKIEKSQKMEELKEFLSKLANMEKQSLNQPKN